MIVQQMGLATDTYPSYSIAVAGPVVTVQVAGVSVVASDLVADSIVHVEVRQLADGSYAVSGVGQYVGTVIIPALSYTDNTNVTDNAGSIVQVASTPVALDPNSIVLQVWPLITPASGGIDIAEPA